MRASDVALQGHGGKDQGIVQESACVCYRVLGSFSRNSFKINMKFLCENFAGIRIGIPGKGFFINYRDWKILF